jgi:hypothetical protein
VEITGLLPYKFKVEPPATEIGVPAGNGLPAGVPELFISVRISAWLKALLNR